MTRFETLSVLKSIMNKKAIALLLVAILTTCCLFVRRASAEPITEGAHPVITEIFVNLYGNTLLVSGHVTDDDNDVAGMIVEIDGDVQGTAVIQPSGNFIAQFDPPFSGIIFASAITTDPDGNESNMAYRYSN